MDEQLPDLSQELASMGRGSMQRRIWQLEASLADSEAELQAAYDQIHDLNNQLQTCKLQDQISKAKDGG